MRCQHDIAATELVLVSMNFKWILSEFRCLGIFEDMTTLARNGGYQCCEVFERVKLGLIGKHDPWPLEIGNGLNKLGRKSQFPGDLGVVFQ
jgi:hypothetical protein